jgi:hypothetical protein
MLTSGRNISLLRHQECDHQNASTVVVTQVCDLWDKMYTAAYNPNPCFNVYSILGQCPLLPDPLDYPTGLQYSYPGRPVHFNRTDVKKALNAPLDIEWLECKGPIFIGNGGPEDEGDTSPGSIQSVLPRQSSRQRIGSRSPTEISTWELLLMGL